MDKINIVDPVTGEEIEIERHPANGIPVGALPDMSDEERERRFGDKMPGATLPVLIRSAFRSDPVEGNQGTFTQIVEEDCEVCGYDRADYSYHTLAGVGLVACRACGATIEEI